MSKRSFVPAAGLAASSSNAASSGATVSLERRLLPIVTGIAVVALVVKAVKKCIVRAARDDLTVVYDVRRRSIFSAAASTPGLVASLAQRIPRTVIHRAYRWLCQPRSGYVVVPPLHAVFSIPASALSPQQGIRTQCVVEDLRVADGILRCALLVHFYVDPREIDRYLSIVGPQPPVQALGRCVSLCLKEEVASSRITAAVLLNRQNHASSSPWMDMYKQRLQSRLVSDCCVVLKDVSLESVDLVV